MSILNKLATSALLTATAVAAIPRIALADVMVTRVTDFGGIMGMGASKNTSTEYIKGNKKREESSTRFTGSILSKFGGTHTSVTIYQVDNNRIVRLNPSHHTYIALPMTADNAQATSGPQDNGNTNRLQTGCSKQEHIRVIRNELTVKATGKHKTISGYRCKEYVMTWLVLTEDRQTKQRSKNIMTSDIWATPETHTLHQLKFEEMTYNHAYLKRLGLDMSPQQQQQFGLDMLGMLSGRNQRDLKRAMRKIHGYPISISVKWQSSAKDNGAGGDEGTNDTVALEHAAGNLSGMLGGLLHGNNSANQPAAAGGMETVFSSTTKIVKINTAAVPARMFEVPDGYHKASY